MTCWKNKGKTLQPTKKQKETNQERLGMIKEAFNEVNVFAPKR